MEFGKLNAGQTKENIDFKLPAEPGLNRNILAGRPAKNVEGYVGCESWGKKEWAGKLFPLNTKDTDYLKYYAQQYNCVELHATHMQLYYEKMFATWKRKVDYNDFIFCPKLYKGITGFGNLQGKEAITKEFLRNISYLKIHLGPIFMELNKSFTPVKKAQIYDYLKTLAQYDFQFFVEVRHPEWFIDEEIWLELIEKLTELKIGLIITDAAGRRDVVHSHLTIPKTMIRFVADDLNEIDLARIDAWVERLKHWIDNGLKEFYFFLHVQNEVMAPEFTIEVIERLNKRCGLNIKKPVLIEKENGLFH